MASVGPQSPYQQIRQMAVMFNGTRPGEEIERGAITAFQQLQKRLAAAVAILRDYERSEVEEDTRAQLRILPKSVKSLEQVRESILKISEYDLIGPADVAQLSAQLDELIDRLR